MELSDVSPAFFNFAQFLDWSTALATASSVRLSVVFKSFPDLLSEGKSSLWVVRLPS